MNINRDTEVQPKMCVKECWDKGVGVCHGKKKESVVRNKRRKRVISMHCQRVREKEKRKGERQGRKDKKREREEEKKRE